MWFLALLVVAVLGLTYLAGTGRFGQMPEPPLDEPTPAVLTTDADLDSAQLRSVRFSVVTRGYSMRQVDALLARVADQLDRDIPAQVPDEFGTSAPVAE